MKFLKNATALFLGIISVFLFSCSEKQTPTPVKTPGCRLESSRWISNAVPDSIRYTYNIAGQLTQVDAFEPTSGDPRGSTLLKYDANGRLIQTMSASGDVNTNFHYNGNGSLFGLSNANQVVHKEYEYNASGHLVKVKGYTTNAGVRTLSSLDVIITNADGQIWKDSTFWINPDGTKRFGGVDEYLYDNKKGISQYVPYLGPENMVMFMPQKHNLVSIKIYDVNGGVHSFSYEYEYNELGYPVKGKFFIKGFHQDSFRFHYSCQ